MALEKIRVAVTGEYSYEAWVDQAVRWNGWLDPHLPIHEVRRLAEHTQADMNDGHQVDTVHVIDGYEFAEEDGATRRRAASVVLKISWDYLFEEGPQQVASIVKPDNDGRYPIGGWEWTWYQVEGGEAE
ncbi:hypothetical protein ACWD4T_31490 [Streptomyces umbrinus]